MNMKAIYIILQDYNKYIIIYINFIFINFTCVEFHDLYVLSQLVCVILTSCHFEIFIYEELYKSELFGLSLINEVTL